MTGPRYPYSYPPATEGMYGFQPRMRPQEYYMPGEEAWGNGGYQPYDPMRGYYGSPPGLQRPLAPSSGYMGRAEKGGYPMYGAPRPDYRPEHRPEYRPRPVAAQYNEFLEEFKQKLTYAKKIDLSELKGHIVELAKDQFGSRHLQQRIQESSPADRQVIFDEIKDCVLPLMSDVFGNYVVQMMIQSGQEAQRNYMIERMKGQVLKLSLDMYGCRCVQKAIEVGTIEQRLALIDEIRPHIDECVESQHANHVLQKCIEAVPPQHIAFLLEYAKNNVMCGALINHRCRQWRRTRTGAG